ncbi:hypothetical protein [Phyllobacterium calauticae]|jgi:hypothetical protein|uniref:hypothetical protein n=1 Tax=Phyllobacterium calauticae TaxID=2817027 RepID=UPI001CBD2D74|nr:hypothetical protein [Phyllobacterium calauticae]MBZ3691516.1 hypothetical protein [Phyllobacterium calauticae]
MNSLENGATGERRHALLQISRLHSTICFWRRILPSLSAMSRRALLLTDGMGLAGLTVATGAWVTGILMPFRKLNTRNNIMIFPPTEMP